MVKLRIVLISVGCFLVGLGLVYMLTAGFSGIFSPQPTLSPFDQTDDVIQPDQSLGASSAPTIPTNMPDLPEQWPTSGPSGTGLPAPAPTVPPTATPAPAWIPDRLSIPAIQLDAPIVPAGIRTVAYLGKDYPQWKVPNFFAAGWAPTSASLGTLGNTVLFGHHNEYGLVFGHLVDLQVGDLIVLYSGERKFTYSVALKMILPERNEPVEVRLQNARWILPSTDERLTLLTCWPALSNSHRLIIVAVPIVAGTAENNPVIPRLTPLAP